MKKIYLNPEIEVVKLNNLNTLLVGSIPGEEGGENSGEEKKDDTGLDEILG